MNKKSIPILNERKFTLEEMYEEDYAIYLKESIITEPVVLNKEAKKIFSYIDGKNNIDEIKNHILSDYNISEEERVYKDIVKELQILWELKILDFVGEDPFQKAVERNIDIYKVSYIREICKDDINVNNDYVCGYWNKNIDYTTTMLNSLDESGILKMFQFKKKNEVLLTIGVTYNLNINIFEIKFIHLANEKDNNIAKFIEPIFLFIKDFYMGTSIVQSDNNIYFLAYVDDFDNNTKDVLKMLSFNKCGELKEELENSNIDLYVCRIQ